MGLLSDREDDTRDAHAPGTIIVPDHRVVRLLRRGHRLDTYDAYSTERDCRCVVKVVRPDRLHEAHSREALLREGRLLQRLAHPNLVRVYEVVEVPQPAYVMETLTGATLGAVIDTELPAPREAGHLGLQLVSALGYLHRQGWLHADVKPSNVVVQPPRAVLIDLSLATPPGDTRPHAGTDGYLAPEQVTGVGLSSATDVFGLGVTLGEVLTGETPYGDEADWHTGTAPRRPARRFWRRLSAAPPQLAEVVLACVDPDPGLRPPLGDLRHVLESVVASGAGESNHG